MAQMKTEGVGGDHRCPFAHHLPDPRCLNPHYCRHPRRPCAELRGLRRARLIALPVIEEIEMNGSVISRWASLPTFMRRECVNLSTRSTVSRKLRFLGIIDGSSTDMSGGYDSDPWPTKKLES